VTVDLFQFLREPRVQRSGLSQPHKRADDVHAHLHRARTVEDGRRHDGAVLGKCDGRVLAVRTTTRV
jgi:hypothetical protein